MSRKRIMALARGLELARPIRIVDVGANPLYDPPYKPLVATGQTELVGFEPQQEAYKELVKSAPDNATFINAAVGADGEGTLHLYKSSGMGSLFPLRAASLNYLRRFKRLLPTETKHPVTLSSLDGLDQVPQIDLLKCDVQGGELDVIKGGAAKLSKAQAIVVELRYYQLYEGEPTMGDLDNQLRAQGFKLHRFLPMAKVGLRSKYRDRLHPTRAKSQLIDGDAVYIRSLEEIDTWSDEALKRLCLMAAGVWYSHDMVLMLLEELENRGLVKPKLARQYISSLPPEMLAPVLEAAQ
ncbi:FkbM family methyltransferase [Algirhabdus cladophorae]|uniref:FkbM family methyltransferase n=1 Tax=Algirhabdus cladophorae TaxID=3377108 RepID=UPI003B848B2E